MSNDMEVEKKFFDKLFCRMSCSPKAYINLIQSNRNYKLYLFSHMCQHGGDWFVRIAALISVGRLAAGSATALSLLVLCRTIPEMVISPFGGILADSFDRRSLMVRLDLIAAVSVSSYMLAVFSGNVNMLFAATILRSTIQALYNPVTTSIVPMIVTDAEDLKIAVTINGMIWSGMLLFGGWFAGLASAVLGVQVCYIIDGLTYIISAWIISYLEGDFSVDHTGIGKGKTGETLIAKGDTKTLILQAVRSFARMNIELFSYVWRCGFGLLVFIKASGCLIWGSADVLNVSFTHVEGDEAESSKRMGIIYSFIGLGCLFGPIIANSTFVHGKKPRTLQLSVVGAMLIMALGWYGIAKHSSSFKMICFFTSVRTLGSACIWINSTLLLQNLTNSEYLGRVLGLEYALARLSETAMAFVAGRLEDGGSTKQQIALMASSVGVSLFFFWSIYHVLGFGAADERFNQISDDEKKEESWNAHKMEAMT